MVFLNNMSKILKNIFASFDILTRQAYIHIFGALVYSFSNEIRSPWEKGYAKIKKIYDLAVMIAVLNPAFLKK